MPKNKVCEKCCQEFANSSSLARHLKRKNGLCSDDNKNLLELAFECQNCKKKFSNKKSLYGHRKKSCKVVKILNSNNKIDDNIIATDNGNINVDKSTHIVNNNNDNITNIVNNNDNSTHIDNTTNIFIQLPSPSCINDFGHEDKRMFENPWTMLYVAFCGCSFGEIIRLLHFNKAYAENMNICTTNDKATLNMVKQGKWTKNKFKQLEFVLFARVTQIYKSVIDNVKPYLPQELFKKIEKFVNDVNDCDSNARKIVIEQIQDSLFENRDCNNFAKKKQIMFEKMSHDFKNKKIKEINKECKQFFRDKYGKVKEVEDFVADEKDAMNFDEKMCEKILNFKKEFLETIPKGKLSKSEKRKLFLHKKNIESFLNSVCEKECKSEVSDSDDEKECRSEVSDCEVSDSDDEKECRSEVSDSDDEKECRSEASDSDDNESSDDEPQKNTKVVEKKNLCYVLENTSDEDTSDEE
jgi:hypothetical protein